jgi:hypothetical protein
MLSQGSYQQDLINTESWQVRILNSAAMNLVGSPCKNPLAGKGAFAGMGGGVMTRARQQQID